MMTDLNHIIQNIETLYSSKDPQQIKVIQNELTRIQLSDNGQLAYNLMLQPSKNCQFFGALTYTVLINKTQKFNPDHLNQIINELQSFLSKSDGMIIKKILSNLSLLFIYNYELYSDPIARLLQGISQSGILDNLHTMSRVIMYCSILVEDLIKKENLAEIHEVIYGEIYSKLKTIYDHLATIEVPFDLDCLSLDCLSSWIMYIPMAESQSKIRYEDVNSLLTFVFNHFSVQNLANLQEDLEAMELINKSINCLTDILEINPQMLNPDMKTYLKSLVFEQDNWGQRFIEAFVLSPEMESEVSNFVNLIIVLVQLDSLSITKNISQPINQYILQLLTKLTDFPGVAIVEENYSDQFLPFWDEFFNVFIDNEEVYEKSLDSIEKNLFYTKRNELCNSICNIYWHKINFPKEFESHKSEFLYFRSNVGDFFSNVYSLLKLPFYEKLTLAAINQMSSGIIDLESTLFILYKINDDCTFYESQSNVLIPFVDQLLNHGLLTSFTSSTIDNDYIFATFINYISSIQFYLKTDHGKNYLGSVFDILFNIMLNSDIRLSLNASKTIVNICQECNNNLQEFIPNLKPLVLEMITNSSFDTLIRKRMVNSFISVAQNETPSNFAHHLLDILNSIEAKALSIMEMINTDNMNEDLETLEEFLLSLLGSIEECGKASILSNEVEELYSDEQINQINKYWNMDELKIKSKILSIINEFSLIFRPFINNSNITETCCQIFKIGLNEPISGPFKFDVSIIFNYVVEKSETFDSTSVGYLFKLIETIVITNPNLVDESIMYQLLENVFINKLDIISSDPDLIAYTTNLFTTILDKKPGILINSPMFRTISEFAIDGLSATESFVNKAISKYWVSLLLMKRGSKANQDSIRKYLVEDNLGPLLTAKLVYTFINTSRSQLDSYYPIFRQLIGKFSPNFKNWLIDVIGKIDIKLDINERERFISKLMLTRGQRAANDILKQFWLKSNGLVEFSTQTY